MWLIEVVLTLFICRHFTSKKRKCLDFQHYLNFEQNLKLSEVTYLQQKLTVKFDETNLNSELFAPFQGALSASWNLCELASLVLVRFAHTFKLSLRSDLVRFAHSSKVNGLK